MSEGLEVMQILFSYPRGIMLEINTIRYLKIAHIFSSAMQHLPRQLFDLATESLGEVRLEKHRVVAEKPLNEKHFLPLAGHTRTPAPQSTACAPVWGPARRWLWSAPFPAPRPLSAEGGGVGAAGGRWMPRGGGRFKSELTGRAARGGAGRKLCLALNIIVLMFHW